MKKFLVSTIATLAFVSPAALAQTTVTLSGWGGGDVAVVNGLLTDVLAEDLAAAGIEVDYSPVDGDFSQWIQNGLSAGTAPDVFYTDIFWNRSIIATGQAQPVRNQALVDSLVPSLAEAFEYEGDVYSVAKDFNTLAVHYNIDIFDDAGVEYPSDDDTWTDLSAKLAAVQSALPDVSGVCVVNDYARFGPFALSAGWQPFNAEGKTVLDDNFRRAFEFYTGLVAAGAGVAVADTGEGWMGGCLGSEKAAVAIEGAWVIGFLRDNAPSMVYGTARMPKDPESGDRGNLIFTVGWTVNAASEVSDAAHTVVELLASEKAQQWVLEQGLALPSRSSMQDNAYLQGDSAEQRANAAVFAGASDGNVTPFFFGDLGGEFMSPINTAIGQVVSGEASVDDALAAAQTRFEQLQAD